MRRLNEGRNPVTVVRDLYTLSSVLRRAVKAGELTENPVRRVDKPRVDRRGKVRFLDQAEETRLRHEPGSANSAGTICVITLLRASSSRVFP